MSHCRILAAELWHQDKNNVAKELGQLRKLKMQQVLKEMEEQDEFKAAQEYYGEKAYQEWIQVIIQNTCHRWNLTPSILTHNIVCKVCVRTFKKNVGMLSNNIFEKLYYSYFGKTEIRIIAFNSFFFIKS